MSLSHARRDTLEVLLGDILSAIKPLEEDVVTRVHVINQFTAVVNSVDSLKGATVEPFGSFLSNLYTKWGDLDLSIEVESGPVVSSAVKRRKVKLLGDLLKALRKRGFARQLEFIRSARVPVLKFQSNHQSISCDISICNLLGQIKSKFLLWIAEIDERFRDMVLLVKEWAKAQSINDPKTGTLNSYSLALLVVFHFQTCKPAILPPLHELYTGNVVDDLTGERQITENYIQDSCSANITRFRASNARNLNSSSVAELFVSFFQKFSRINAMAAEHVVCTYTGQWELRRTKNNWTAKTYPLLIEDPFEQPENTARAVNEARLCRITEAFASTYSHLSGNLDQSSLVNVLVESHIRSMFLKRVRVNPSVNGGLAQHPRLSSMVHPSRHQSQKMRLETYSPRNFSYEKPDFLSQVHQTPNQFQDMEMHLPLPISRTVNPTQNHFQQRPPPQISGTVYPPQNHFQQRPPQFPGTSYPTQNHFQQRPPPQISGVVYPTENHFQQRPPQISSAIHPTLNGFQVESLTSHNPSSQRPRFSNPSHMSQNQVHKMQSDSHPSPGSISQRPQYPYAVPNQHQIMQSESQSNSSVFSQRPVQAGRGRGQQMWRPRHPER